MLLLEKSIGFSAQILSGFNSHISFIKPPLNLHISLLGFSPLSSPIFVSPIFSLVCLLFLITMLQMMKWGMEIISPTSYLPNSNWFLGDQKCSNWTHEENKLFENALAIYDKDAPDRWQKVAAMIPGKTVLDVIKHYKDLEDDVSDIEAGLIQIPGYSSSFTLEWVNNHEFEGLKPSTGIKKQTGRPEQERKKGVPWTEDEHRLFLLGLKKYGKGDWRNISRNFVISRTPTQVASHAQKYFIRQGSGGKDKRRSSIHDITTVSVTDDGLPPSPAQSPKLPIQPRLAGDTKIQDQFSLLFQPSRSSQDATFLSPTASQRHGNSHMQPPFGITPYGMKLQAHNFHRGHQSQLGPHSMVFPLESPQRPHPHG